MTYGHILCSLGVVYHNFMCLSFLWCLQTCEKEIRLTPFVAYSAIKFHVPK